MKALKATGVWFIYFIISGTVLFLLSDSKTVSPGLIVGSVLTGFSGMAIYIVQNRRRPEKPGGGKA